MITKNRSFKVLSIDVSRDHFEISSNSIREAYLTVHKTFSYCLGTQVGDLSSGEWLPWSMSVCSLLSAEEKDRREKQLDGREKRADGKDINKKWASGGPFLILTYAVRNTINNFKSVSLADLTSRNRNMIPAWLYYVKVL